jgi:hypothetical protein
VISSICCQGQNKKDVPLQKLEGTQGGNWMRKPETVCFAKKRAADRHHQLSWCCCQRLVASPLAAVLAFDANRQLNILLGHIL